MGLFCGVAGLILDSFLFVLRGSRVDSTINKRDQKEKKSGFSPFADTTDQVDAKARLRGVDIDELLRKARESNDDLIVLDNYQETEDKGDNKKGTNNNNKDKEKKQPNPPAKNKKEKNSGKTKTA